MTDFDPDESAQEIADPENFKEIKNPMMDDPPVEIWIDGKREIY